MASLADRARVATRLLRSSTFRLALLYAAIFGVSVTALLGFIYWATAGYMARQTDTAIAAEIETLAERYQLTGVAGLADLIGERVHAEPTGGPVYLLADSAYHIVAGNLDAWPAAAPDPQGWIRFSPDEVVGHGVGKPRPVRARAFVLPGDFHLLVGRDARELEAMHNLVLRALGWGLAATALLAIAGGAFVSRATARRIEAITVASRAIMAGDLGRRIPASGGGDDFDRLTDQLNRMLDRIQGLMEDVRRVSDNIAHDLRTPLTRLRHRLERLSGATPDEREEVEGAIEEANQLLATFNALLRIARVEAGTSASAETIELEPIALDVAELYAPVAEAKDVELVVDATAACARGERDLVFQAFANLVDNAVKYTPPGGRVRVAVVAGGGLASLLVTDTGPGIPAADRERVLERFVRLEASRTTPGNGLGLSLVAAIARRQGGRVVLADAEPGLAVRIDLPAAPTPQPDPAEPAAKPSPDAAPTSDLPAITSV